MKRLQQMLKTHDRDHLEIVRRLQFTLDCIGEGEMDAAKSEIMEAYRAAKKSEAAFNELALLVGVLLVELQQIDQTIEENTTTTMTATSNLMSASAAETTFVTLLKRLHIDEDSPF